MQTGNSFHSPIRSGLWTTKGGSRLVLKIESNGFASGFYSTSHGRPTPNETFSIVGWVNYDLIGLTCAWGEYRSVSTWCGRHFKNGSQGQIHYMWHLAREFEDKSQTQKTELTFTFHTMSGVFEYQGPEEESGNS